MEGGQRDQSETRSFAGEKGKGEGMSEMSDKDIVKYEDTRACASEFDRYRAIPEYQAYIASELFRQRCDRLVELMEHGEISVAGTAKLLDLPINVCRHLFAHYIANTLFLMQSSKNRRMENRIDELKHSRCGAAVDLSRYP
jgi:hypothetical protein